MGGDLMDRMTREMALKQSTAMEDELRRLLLGMRATGKWRRYMLVTHPKISPLIRDADVFRYEMTCSMGVVDEIPAGFHGTVYELTADALAEAFELIDAGREG